MTSYQIEVRECPNCGCEFWALAVGSCNTFGAKWYTDGFVHGPMYDEGSAVLACPKCNAYLWREDVPTRESMRDSEYFQDPERRSLPEATQVYSCDHENLLRQKSWNNPTQEKYIRIRVWWSFNAVYRHGHGEDFDMPAEQEENLRRLLQLMDTNKEDSFVMQAEILRELGQFDECLEAADQVSGKRYSEAVDTIRKLAKAGKRKVRIVE